MTVQTTAVNTQILGNGSTTTFTFAFNIPSAAEMNVWLVNTDSGARTLLDPSEYTATGPFGDEAGGDVEYPISGDPIDDPAAILIERVVPYTQPTAISSQDGFNPEVQEDALDWLEFQIQQIADKTERAILVAPGEDGLVASETLVEGNLLQVGPNNSLVNGPSGADIALVAALAEDILDIVTGVAPAGRYVMTAYDPTGQSDILVCDGSAVSRTTYALLFAKISDDYGPGDSISTFNLPDMRGQFIRGHSGAATTDPDKLTRTDRGDGQTGNVVGTKQADATESHTHTGTTASNGAHTHDFTVGADEGAIIFDTGDFTGGSGVTAAGADATAPTGNLTLHQVTGVLSNGAHTHTFTSAATGGNETRPTNITAYICITTGLAA